MPGRAATRKPAAAPTRPRASASERRTIAGLENELGVVRRELSRVDGRNRRLSSAPRYAQQLLVLVAVLALFYVFLLHQRYRGVA